MTEYARLVIAADSTDVRSAERDLAGLERRSSLTESAVVKMAAGIGAALGSMKVAAYARDAADLHSRYEQLGGILEVVGRNTGHSSDLMHKYAAEVKSMGITMQGSRSAVISMAQANLDLARSSDLARMAQDAAAVAGINSSEALDRIITAIQTNNVEMLRTIGISVSFEEGYRRMAAETGKVATQLTEAEKAQARMNLVMSAGSQIAGAYSISMDSASKQLGSMDRYLNDIKTLVGEAFSEVYRDSVFGVSDALKSVNEALTQMKESGQLEKIADAVGALGRGAAVSAKLVAAYVAAVYTIPAAKAAASLATAGYSKVLAAFSVQAAMTTSTLLTMRTALGVVGSAFAGWQIGTYLRNEFEIVEKAGIALMSGLHQSAIYVGGAFEALGEGMKFALTNPISFARSQIADFLGWVAGLGAGALRLLGLEGLADGIKTEFAGIRGATAAEHKATMRAIRQQTSAEMAGVSDIYFEMFDSVGKNVKDTTGGISDLKGEVAGLGGGGAADGVKKLDTAFVSLMDSLFPAEAAQRKYGEQVDLLKKYLSGDQLAKAIDRLNFAMEGADATGPADAIEEYRKELQRLEDQLDPVGKATSQYQKDVERLNDAMERGERSPERTAELLAELERQYKDNTKATSDWAKWTEGALDRVDSAFADAWRNIGDGFSSFRDSLTNAFKQMLAELAHMAITKPIIMQFGSMMGIGGGTQGNNGIWGSLLGGGSGSGGGGGNSIAGIANQANNIRSLYSMYGAAQSLWPALQGGFANGGFSGALGAAGSYFGGMLGIGSGAAASSAAGSVASGYTGAAMANWVAAQTASTAATTTLTTTISGTLAKALSGMTAALSNPYMWAAVGLMSSWKLYGQGIRGDGGEMRQTWSNTSGLAGELGNSVSFLSSVYERHDKIVGSVIGDKLANVLSGGPVVQALGMAIHRLFGSGEKYKRTVGSAQGSYSAGEYTGNGAVESWFGGSKRFGDDFDQSLHGLNEAFASSLGGLFEMFDIDSDIMTTATARLRRTSGRLATVFAAEFEDQTLMVKGQFGSGGNVQKGLQKFVDQVMGNVLAQAIGKSSLPEYLKEQVEGLKKAGEVSEAIGQLFMRFEGVNTTLENLNFAAYSLTDAGLRGADALLDLSAAIAGLEDPTTADKIASLTSLTSTYYDQFFTASEKTEDTIDSITRAFEAADVELVGSREAYRAMVEDIDLTTEAGREMFATMMALSGQAAQYFSIVEQQAAQAQALLGANVNSAYGTLQRSIQTERDRLTRNYQAQLAAEQQAASARSSAYADMISTASSSVQALRGLDSALDRALKTLLGTSDTAVEMMRKQAVSTLQAALQMGRSGKSLAGFSGLEDALDAASRVDTDVYSTLSDFEREQGRTANLIAELGAINSKQLTAEEKLLAQLQASSAAVQGSIGGVSSALTAEYERAMAALDEELAAAQSQLDALNGIDNSVMTVAAAVAQMSSAVVAALNYQTGNTDTGAGVNSSMISQLYTSILGYDADSEGQAHWQGRLSGGDTYTDLITALKLQAGAAAYNPAADTQAIIERLKWQAATGVPAFASGGFHAGGLRLVGERGPELEATGPSRIYNASQTAAMLGGAGSTEELRALRSEVAGLRSALGAIAKYTESTAYGVRQMNEIGIPQEEAA